MNKGKKFLSDLKLHSDYFKWLDDKGRYETWEEACESIIDGHRKKYEGLDLESELKVAKKQLLDKRVLASQRNLQYRHPQLIKNNARMYNCFHKETEFITSSGVRKFSDFRNGSKIKVLTHLGTYEKATVKSYGKQLLNRITFKKNNNISYVLATGNHRWILLDGENTTNLSVDDRIYRQPAIFKNFNYEEANPLERLYWCYGMVYGDGTKIKYNGEYTYSAIRLCGNDKYFANRFEECGFKTSSSLSLKGDFMAYTGTYLKEAPDPEKDSPEMIRAFVAGYLAADGTKNRNITGDRSYYDYIQSSEEDHIDFIRECFPIAGVYIISETDLTGEVTNYGERPHTIKFRISQEIARNSVYKVIEIEENISEEEVWCLEVENNQSFVMPNGIVTGNCVGSLFDKPDLFQKYFFILLSGCGLDFSLRKKFIDQLPQIKRRTTGTKTFFVEDSVEGWADALGVLMSSYFIENQPFPEYAGYEIKFDYSFIRPKGAFISGGFRAPGPEGLKQSLEKIENLIENWLFTEGNTIRSILAYDIIMHSSDAVLSGGVRRSACSVLIDEDDEEMIQAKLGNWRQNNPQRARSNNAIGLLRNSFSQEKLDRIIKLNQGDNDISFIFVHDEYEVSNPCREITFRPVLEDGRTAIQMCNLTEINASECSTVGQFNKACVAASLLGTLQAGYTSFPYLGKDTEELVRREALIGVSITGWMNQPWMLSNKDALQVGAELVKSVNIVFSKKIGINPAARTTTVKPSGNASVILGTASGIHPEHSERYFRVMQLNKESDTAKWLEKNMPFLLEESYWSNTKSDYVVFVPIENPKDGFYKKDMKGIKHLDVIRFVQENWVNPGTNIDACLKPWLRNSVSCTVIVDNQDEVTEYIYKHQDNFKAVSFISDYGDKDFNQAPFTSVSSLEEIVANYGKGALFISGLIVDALHYFNNDLWIASDLVRDNSIPITGTREQVLLKKYWLSRAKKFAKNFFDGDIKKLIYCLKDVHLLHKWELINREFFQVNFGAILSAPTYKDVSSYAAVACSGGSCEITKF